MDYPPGLVRGVENVYLILRVSECQVWSALIAGVAVTSFFNLGFI